MFDLEDLKYLFKNGVVESKDIYRQDLKRNQIVIDEIDKYNKGFSQSMFLSWISNIFLRYLMLCSSNDDKVQLEAFERIHILNNINPDWHTSLDIYNKYKDIKVNFADYIDYTHTDNEDFILLKICLLCTINGTTEISYNENLYYDIKLRKSNDVKNSNNVNSYTSNCPNCGAPTNISTFGVCNHCQELISIYDNVWKIVSIALNK